MEFFNVVRERHSYRGPFLEKGISREDLMKIADAGIRAPSGMNCQTTSFIIVTDKEQRDRIASVFPTSAVKTAPAIIAVLTQAVTTACGLSFELEDYAASVMSMLLAITDLGYATVWMDGMTRARDANQALRRILNVPPEKTIRTILPIGAAAITTTQGSRMPFRDRCSWDRYGENG